MVVETNEIGDDVIGNVFNAALEAGYTKRFAQELSLRKLELRQLYDMDKAEAECDIRRHVPKRYISNLAELSTVPGKKAEKLWEMGFDISKGLWEDVCIFREKGRVIVEECFVGSERTDKAWVNLIIDGTHVASFTARVAHKKDPTLERELRKMSGGMYG